MKLLFGKWHRTPLMISQHWFMWWLGAVTRPHCVKPGSSYSEWKEYKNNWKHDPESINQIWPTSNIMCWTNAGQNFSKLTHEILKTATCYANNIFKCIFMKEKYVSRFLFHWILFNGVQLIISQHWLKQWPDKPSKHFFHLQKQI